MRGRRHRFIRRRAQSFPVTVNLSKGQMVRVRRGDLYRSLALRYRPCAGYGMNRVAKFSAVNLSFRFGSVCLKASCFSFLVHAVNGVFIVNGKSVVWPKFAVAGDWSMPDSVSELEV